MTTPNQTIPSFIQLSPLDNIVVARRALNPGDALTLASGVTVGAKVPIGAGHKIAVAPIASGKPVLRYGQIIGFASTDIAPGDHVHVHNIAMRDFDRDYAYCEGATPTQMVKEPRTFNGIVRADGRVATRNYVGVLTSVNCSATVARFVADAFRRDPITGHNPLAEFPNVDGVVALTHRTGCGMDGVGEGLALLRRTIAGFARHPNFSHVFMLGLGCESNQLDELLDKERLLRTRAAIPIINIQTAGGTRKAVERGVAMIREVLADANRVTRQPVALSNLVVALQCGGSDGYSGITANPALGVAADRVVQHGGSAILAETPEIYGAEHLLTRRAESRAVGEKLVAHIKWWEKYTSSNGGNMDNNPSPGNKAGGLTTILEKSLGAMAKGGSTNLVDVLAYAEPLKKRGFNFMDSPGYDPVSVTGEVASGANVVCFTTGRGSVFGCVPSPSLKLATNSGVFERMPEDMDINCGGIVEGKETLEACGERIFERIIATASGEQTLSERQGFGESEFSPWQIGAVM